MKKILFYLLISAALTAPCGMSADEKKPEKTVSYQEANQACEDLLDKAVELLEAKKYKEAVLLFQNAASQGSTAALINLSECAENGWGMPRSPEQARKYLDAAAQKGDPDAYMIQAVHACAKGDFGSAVPFWEKASALGNTQALMNLGQYYLLKDPDSAKMQEYLNKAMLAGCSDAALLLGKLFWSGKSVAKDRARAASYFEVAADRGDKEAQNVLGTLYFRGDGVARDFVKAQSLFKQSAAQKYPPAIVNLGRMYALDGTPEHNAESFKLFNSLNDSDYASAHCELANAYLTGTGVKYDPAMARKHAEKAASLNPALGYRTLGMVENFAGNPEAAFANYLKAAEKGDYLAQFTVSEMLLEGKGTAKDEAKAAEWRKRALETQRAVSEKLSAELQKDGPAK